MARTPYHTDTGHGGETQQRGGETMTSNHGIPVSDNQNSLRAGARGPTLLEDFLLREKIFHFDHERIPERIVHARGSGAHGHFECTDPIPELSRAALFAEKGKRTPVFARFSTVAGGAGSVDTPRDVRGFAVKFYTEQGNWDLVGNNIPVFFIQDALKFPDLVHSVKMEADRGYPQAASAHDTFWDFVSLMPESLHAVIWAMSDRAIPRSLRMMQGFGVHTFKLVNDAGQEHFVKFHWRPILGTQSLVWDESAKLQGADNDYHRRDLFEAIARGDFPQWDLAVQVFDQELADSLPYDVLDATKIIPEELVPLRVVGRMTLDRNPDNFFAETEQVAFLPSNVVPGIDFTDDPLLQGRLFSYLDTQKSRLGTTNFHQIPVNAPKCPYANMMRDGMMQTAVPKGRANYEPNSLAQAGEDPGPRASDQGFATAPQQVQGQKLRIRAESFGDHYSQPRMFWRSQTESEQAHIASAFVFELSKVGLEHVRQRVVSHLRNIDEDLAARVAKGLGIDLPAAAKPFRAPLDLPPSDALSIQKNWQDTLQGRSVGLLFSAGSDKAAIDELIAAVEAEGGHVFTIAPKVGPQQLKGGTMTADGQLAGSPSVLFDAVAMILAPDEAERLSRDAAALGFVMDAHAHLKAIGHCPGSKVILDRLGIAADAGIVAPADLPKAARRRYWDREPTLRDLA
ncbi:MULTISPECIES: catalase [unclassified Paracoccus (in: a-proteobacteria)]|uniref:catalase n=1 Tax=unclassified Paracoccus (in: a-proteobacteria) TaxID=2688777 RepID=UPI0012B35376|nr:MULTISPECIES: catalase [unclassified Paracoccus (in: a-proteobacteria)]UXU76620.1 catalase [Paracoccus sp. SMMA_5]UXU82508.1 catalase [Paracoccus sp. SMMA_5_TC]